MALRTRTPRARAFLPVTRSQSSGPLGALLSSPALDVRLITALQVLQVLQALTVIPPAIRVGELQEDPLTRFLLRYDEFETGGELTDGNGKRIKMGKDSEPLRSGKGRAVNVKVAQTCLALHVSHQFTHCAATDGGKDREDKMAGGAFGCCRAPWWSEQRSGKSRAVHPARWRRF